MRRCWLNPESRYRLTACLSLLLVFATVMAPLHACCLMSAAPDQAASVDHSAHAMHMAATGNDAAMSSAGMGDCPGVCSTCASCDGWQQGVALIHAAPVFVTPVLSAAFLPDSNAPLLSLRFQRQYVSRGPPTTLS